MSVPSIEFICDKCRDTGATGLVHGPMMYRDRDKEYDVNRCLGWCNDCDGFAPIENFSDTDDVLKKLAKVTDELQYLYSKRIVLFLTGISPWTALMSSIEVSGLQSRLTGKTG